MDIWLSVGLLKRINKVRDDDESVTEFIERAVSKLVVELEYENRRK